MTTPSLIITVLVAVALSAPALRSSPTADPVVERGYRQMYDLNFDGAHRTFAGWEREHPADPLGPVSNAAAYLFAEFDRLGILQSEFFVEDNRFKKGPKMAADPNARRAFEDELSKADQLSEDTLRRAPEQPDAMFAKILALGLRADYQSLIERRYFDSLKIIKNTRAMAEKLLSIEPGYYDAYLAIGVENYLFSLKVAPMRWLLQMGGAETNRERGLEDLRLTAEKGAYLSPYARLLLAVAALRNKDRAMARDILDGLAREFPHNRLYTEELARLQQNRPTNSSHPHT